jgi:hypothetical protein
VASMTSSNSRIRALSLSPEMSVEWQVGGEDLVKDNDEDEEERGRLRSRSEEVVHSQYTVAASRTLPYGYGSLSMDDEIRASTRHGFKGVPQKKVTLVVSGNTGCLVLSVTFFAFVMALIGLWIMPAPAPVDFVSSAQ